MDYRYFIFELENGTTIGSRFKENDKEAREKAQILAQAAAINHDYDYKIKSIREVSCIDCTNADLMVN